MTRGRHESGETLSSTQITRVSAAVLLTAGLALLFAPDVVLPRLIPAYPPTAHWLGQLLGAAWLGVAALNWGSRATILGGIYGRPIVLANLAIYFVGALVMLGAARRAELPGAVWTAVALAVVLAVTYVWLLWRGPSAKDWGKRDAS
jgi:hypothetical protein